MHEPLYILYIHKHPKGRDFFHHAFIDSIASEQFLHHFFFGALIDIKKGLENNLPIDILEIDLKHIWELLGSIIGETYEDELIDQLFSQFCLGK